MSCQIKGVAYIIDPSEVKSRLFNDSTVKVRSTPKNELPLEECYISLSSSGDVMAIGFLKNIVILTSKWDTQEPGDIKNKFHITWSGCLSDESNITSLLCLPLISNGKSTGINSGPDWTCIAVGFNTGYVRFYTELGALLLEEQLNNGPILEIKCQSMSSPRHVGDTGSTEEIYILYNTVICILPGFQLFSTLRACRNHLARVQANCTDKPPSSTLTFKKLGFKDQDMTNDCEIIGTTSVTSFDHLMTASLCGGFNANYRSSAPQHNLIISTGKRPYVGFHFAIEGSAAPILSDFALAMAHSFATAFGKIGDSVPWFRNDTKSTNNNADKTKGPVNELPEPMTCRFGLSDIMREGESLIISPNKQLSVVTDVMGRVILINNKRGIALRMWKGYRDAQCGWIQVVEDKHRGSGEKNSRNNLRTALFLVIYAPRKGIIDIWSIQQGGKITTFSASKTGRLLYINYGLLGLNNIPSKFFNRPQYSCVFIDPLGGLKEIIVPFHFALSSKNGKRARDVHLLKKLKTFLREEEFNDDKLIIEVINICDELKTNEIRMQIVEILMTNKHTIPDALLAAVNCFIKVLIQYDDDELEPIGKSLYHISIQLQKVIEFYKYVRLQYDKPPEYNTVASQNIPTSNYLAHILLTSEREINRILKLSLDLYKYEELTKPQNRVTFKDDGGLFLEFISCFDFGAQNNVGLIKNINDDKKYQIASLIYQGWMYSCESTVDFEDAAQQSNICAQTMMQLALIYWLEKRPGAPLEIELMRFTLLLHSICTLGNPEEINMEYNEMSSWWRDTRNILMESTKPFQALTASLACRSVGIALQKSKDSNYDEKIHDDNKPNESDDKIPKEDMINASTSDNLQNSTGDWENVSKDTCQFTLLISNLEDIAILNALLNKSPPSHDETTQFFALPFEKLDISLGNIVARGKGSVSEIVARWLASSGIDPVQLIDPTDVEFNCIISNSTENESILAIDKTINDDSASVNLSTVDCIQLADPLVKIADEVMINITSASQILEKLTLLKQHFPYSLTSSVLLANLCWQFVMAWSKDIAQLDIFNAALLVLQNIPMKSMRQGVCCLLWTIHIKKRMEAAAKLINKLGKLPKERLCIQDIGLSDVQSVIFLKHCVEFLDIFLDAEVLEGESTMSIKSDELWEGHSIQGPESFAALAISQISAWYDLIMLHSQLANVLHMIAHFNLKSIKPMTNLFDSVTNRYFFQDITDKPIITWYHDDKRDNLRLEFLCRVITASMESINQETNECNGLTSTQAIEWMNKCQILASIWKLNIDKLRIHQVCEFYVNGFDRLADEALIAINDTETLAINLLPIAGRRMMGYLSKTPDLLEEISRINPALMQYLDNLNINSSSVILTSCSNDDTIELIKKISRYLPDTHSDYHFSQMMLDATFIYENTTRSNI
ncbi:hypothetical protein PV328_011418 [Microctonus aethiopoides]|uniref:Rab3 GTPase-activating protein non-catalytic subunit n=1 Tax=Microctonus aethiopoides TaxID=144406 RepID=A0AA39C5A7_9HYME|nr:hypothetical protein PV328_011418 [Microctonus aethiopoides]